MKKVILTLILVFGRNRDDCVLNVFILIHFRLIFGLIKVGWIVILVTNSNSNVLGNCRERWESRMVTKESRNHERIRGEKDGKRKMEKKREKDSKKKRDRKFEKVSKVSRLLELRTKVSTGTR